MKTKILTRQAIVCAIYVALTVSLPMFSYGPIQFRISEVLNLLAFFNPIYLPAITLGVAISNIGSTLGVIDIVFGTFHTFISLFCMTKTKNIYLASLFPAIFSFIIGIEIAIVSATMEGFFITTLQIMASEFIICAVIGIPIMKYLTRHQKFRESLLIEK